MLRMALMMCGTVRGMTGIESVSVSVDITSVVADVTSCGALTWELVGIEGIDVGPTKQRRVVAVVVAREVNGWL